MATKHRGKHYQEIEEPLAEYLHRDEPKSDKDMCDPITGLYGWSGHSGLDGDNYIQWQTTGQEGTLGDDPRTHGTIGSCAGGASGVSGHSGFSGFSGCSGTSGISGWSGWSGQGGCAGTSGYNAASGVNHESSNFYFDTTTSNLHVEGMCVSPPGHVAIDAGGGKIRNLGDVNQNDDDSAANVKFVKKYVEDEIKKVQKTFSIDNRIYDEFDVVADRKSINKSKFIENKMVDFIKENNDGKIHNYAIFYYESSSTTIRANKFYLQDGFFVFEISGEIVAMVSASNVKSIVKVEEFSNI
jgi:hypothetical protein